MPERSPLSPSEKRDMLASFPDLYAVLMQHGFLKFFAAEVIARFKMHIEEFACLDVRSVTQRMHDFPSIGASTAIIPVLLQIQHDIQHQIHFTDAREHTMRKKLNRDIIDAEKAHEKSISRRFDGVMPNPYVI